jgi:hypothetical protein
MRSAEGSPQRWTKERALRAGEHPLADVTRDAPADVHTKNLVDFDLTPAVGIAEISP